jgi:hypothetical protein
MQIIGYNDPDGAIYGSSPAAKIGFYGAPGIPQRSIPMQASIKNFGGGQLVTVYFQWTPIGITGQTVLENTAFYITPSFAASTANFCVTSDFLLAINKSTAMAGVGLCTGRLAANQILTTWANPTSAPVTPTSDTYAAVIAQNLPVIAQVITPSGIASLTTQEQVFTIQGTGATGTAVLNSAGQVIGVNITNGGAGYFYPPAVIFAGGPKEGGIITPLSSALIGGSPFSTTFADPTAGNVTGTYDGLQKATANAPYSSGASGTAVVNSSGVIVGVIITNPGGPYLAAPTVSFVGGNTFSPGMCIHVNKSSASNSMLGIVNARVVGPYQIGITFINDSTSPITPTGETFRFMAFNELQAASNRVEYVWTANTPVMSLSGVTGGALEVAVTLPGINLNDTCLSVQRSFNVTSGGILGGVVNAASSLGIQLISLSNGAVTIKAGEFIGAYVWKQNLVAPSSLLVPYLSTTTAITANTTAEITYTITGLPAAVAVNVNKPTLTPGICIVNARAAANTLYLTWHNNTANAVTVPSEFYLLEVFNQTLPANAYAISPLCAYHIQSIIPAFNGLVDRVNEDRAVLAGLGLMAGY